MAGECEVCGLGDASPDDHPREELVRICARLRTALAAAEGREAALVAWTHTFGSALKPTGADTYGEGMRDAKAQVAAILIPATEPRTP